MARPSKLTPKLLDAIVASVRRGVHIETVAALHGIHKDTFYTWLKEGARENQRRDAGRRHPTGTDRKVKDRLSLAAKFSDAVALACAEVEASGVDTWQASFEIREVLRVDGRPLLDDDGNAKTVVVGTDWRAVQAFHERRFPDRWKPRSEQALTGADGGAIQTEDAGGFDLKALSAEDLRTFMALKRKAQQQDGDV